MRAEAGNNEKALSVTEIQNWLVSYMAELIEVPHNEIDVKVPFDEYGLDSSMSVTMVADLETWLGRRLSPSLLWDYSTIEQLTQSLVGESEPASKQSIRDWNAEAILDPAICPSVAQIQPATEPAAIFLTGATGFLGAFLLRELLEQTQADIYCLVRSSDNESARVRLEKNLESYGIWNQAFSSRIIPILGDLSQPQFGLSPETFQIMAAQIDAIYHSAALLNYVYPYERLKPINVLGTQEVLRLASFIKVKPVHYISSVAVLALPYLLC